MNFVCKSLVIGAAMPVILQQEQCILLVTSLFSEKSDERFTSHQQNLISFIVDLTSAICTIKKGLTFD